MTQLLNDEAQAVLKRAARARLGEELPIFCERCGYSLHGATQVRCERCDILQFHCPECGHHQPINTLRPAAQRILGRLWALWLGWAVFWRLNFFGWMLFGWGVLGFAWMEWLYWRRHYLQSPMPAADPLIGFIPGWIQRELDLEWIIAAFVMGLAFGLVGRLALLRWKLAFPVGLILAQLAVVAMLVGVRFYMIESTVRYFHSTRSLAVLLGLSGVMVVAGAMMAWPILAGLVKVFLPARASGPLLDWLRWNEKQVDILAR